jgi:hypothetical protein
MTDPKYMGITGAVIEAGDIMDELGVSYANAMEIQAQRSAERLQAYLDADREIESNVIYGVPFGRGRCKDEKTVGAL